MSDIHTLGECLGLVSRPSCTDNATMKCSNNLWSWLCCSLGIYFAENSSKSNQYVYGIGGGNGCPGHKDRFCYICLRLAFLCVGVDGVWMCVSVWSVLGRYGLGNSLFTPSLSSHCSPPQETTSVQGDTRQTCGTHHCHQDRTCTPWPPLSHWKTQRRRTQLSRICHLSWRTGHSCN